MTVDGEETGVLFTEGVREEEPFVIISLVSTSPLQITCPGLDLFVYNADFDIPFTDSVSERSLDGEVDVTAAEWETVEQLVL
jgi:hypothetical protein